MRQTLTGWALLAIIIVSGCASIATAVKLLISGFGMAPQNSRDLHAAYFFGALLAVATMLVIWLEPILI